jgi:hypothetical protein
MKIRSKQWLDQVVADTFGLRRREVAYVTQAFLEELVAALVRLEEVNLAGMFKLRVHEARGLGERRFIDVKGRGASKRVLIRTATVNRQLRLWAKKSEALSKRLREKYGPSAHIQENDDAREVRGGRGSSRGHAKAGRARVPAVRQGARDPGPDPTVPRARK